MHPYFHAMRLTTSSRCGTMTSSAWQDDDNVAAPCGRRRRQGNVVICRMRRRLHHRHAWRRHRYIRRSTAISHLLANYYTKLPQWRPKLWWCRPLLQLRPLRLMALPLHMRSSISYHSPRQEAERGSRQQLAILETATTEWQLKFDSCTLSSDKQLLQLSQCCKLTFRLRWTLCLICHFWVTDRLISSGVQ